MTMQRSKGAEGFQSSQVNASWGDVPAALSAAMECPSQPQTAFSPLQSHEFPHERFGHRLAEQNCPKASLVDNDKMKRLLGMLRSNEFCGKFDPDSHGRYLQPPMLDLGDEQSTESQHHVRLLKAERRSFGHGLSKHLDRKSQFKDALKKIKSTPAVSGST
jgi:hypothetical protein